MSLKSLHLMINEEQARHPELTTSLVHQCLLESTVNRHSVCLVFSSVIKVLFYIMKAIIQKKEIKFIFGEIILRMLRLHGRLF